MKFILGERKEVKVNIISTSTAPFVIRNPVFTLYRNSNEEAVQTGECSINDKELTAVIQPPAKGLYTLMFTYEVANEILKAPVPINVERY
ncbi:hypothetical protein M3221_13475 [Domibacillus indicus]|uniref:hypothetical protein n=1 Tax=Domibacillus indicus TaxID=1437523 RepID=UPI00203FEE7F|nr:hypothetical protein [Domibacillus indicus]MCM3789411.1 hypothetical protein [Domibacillus indicus]